eukprot:Hpha_TRINITY_DN10454_c0_g1::TRINITY_DN10454_c0_g1_i1::g.193205::m.193205
MVFDKVAPEIGLKIDDDDDITKDEVIRRIRAKLEIIIDWSKFPTIDELVQKLRFTRAAPEKIISVLRIAGAEPAKTPGEIRRRKESMGLSLVTITSIMQAAGLY